MATIPSGQKFHTVPSNVETGNLGSKLANSNREIFTMQDIVQTVSTNNISFLVSKEQFAPSSWIEGKYYLLGIDFGDMTFEEGKTYTLLIDRWRNAEFKREDDTTGVRYYREARFYHEKVQDAIENNRLSEVEITSNIQYFDFNQDRYFRPVVGNKFPQFTGHGARGSVGNTASFLRLGFRIRIDNGVDAPTETGNLGYITMTFSEDGSSSGQHTVSYRQGT